MELVSLGVEKLWDQLSHEYKTLKGVEDQVSELKSNLNLLKSFLKDADAKKHTNEMVRHCVEEIKEIVYDAEDTIETYTLKKKIENKIGIITRIRRFACTTVDRRELASDIGRISKRISKVIHNMQSFGVQQMLTNSRLSAHPLQERQKEMRHQFVKSYESNLVGLEANVKKLVGYLAEKDEIQIISVTGMGGLGKTTLARQVYNHEDVKRKFDVLVWVCVSQDFTRKKIWKKILGGLKQKEEERTILGRTESLFQDKIKKMNEDELQDHLFQLLKMSKTLIVLDDIWNKEDWDLIKPIFPPTKGWMVLITSRNEWYGMRGDTKYTNFKPEYLTFKDSWTLFERIAMPRKDAPEFMFDKEMEEVGEQMVKHCGGLPLAIKVLGGLLAEKYTLHDWKRLSENIGYHLMGGKSDIKDHKDNSCYYVLSLSYEELPSYLKHCFLYLALFPEDYGIEIEKLCYYWAAEGISNHRSYDVENIQDVGDSYIEELVRRNMVISERDKLSLRYEFCQLHDMMRDICLLKAKEENFLHFISSNPPAANFQSSITSRRCVLHDATKLQVERDLNNPKLRSLVVLPVERYGRKLSSSNYTRLELLRVLDLSDVDFEGKSLASGIGKLIHLRYLSLENAKVSHLPCSIGKLKLLIYLNLDISLDDNNRSIFVPNVLMGMQELRYLVLPDEMHEKTNLELSNQVKLEILRNFSTKHSSLEDIRGMVKLKALTIKSTKETSMKTISALIEGLRYLEILHIWFKKGIEDELVLDFAPLEMLILQEIPRLPKEQHFPSCLKVLRLYKCCLEEDPMPVLEKLVELRRVGLHEISFGRRMVCSGSGFPNLQELEISGLENLEEWIVEEGSMPLLQLLDIRNCLKLKELPDGLRFITSIKDLIIDKKWKEKLSKGGEEYYKVEHIPYVHFIEW